MKKYLLSFALAFMSLTAFAQADYDKVMAEKVSKVETAKSAAEFQALTDDFHRIAGKNDSKWLPFYYAALASVQKGRTMMREGKTADLDFQAGLAEKYLAAAANVAPADNAEIHLLRKMAYSLRMMVNPQERFATYGKKAEEELKIAEKLDPNNPRVTLIKAEDTYFTPEQYGGSKTKGMELFKKSVAQFGSYTPKAAFEPNWGKAEAEYFVKQAK